MTRTKKVEAKKPAPKKTFRTHDADPAALEVTDPTVFLSDIAASLRGILDVLNHSFARNDLPGTDPVSVAYQEEVRKAAAECCTTLDAFVNKPGRTLGRCAACAEDLTKENSSKSPTTGNLTHIGCKVVQGPTKAKKVEAPVEEAEVAYPTYDDLRAAMLACAKAHGADEVRARLKFAGFDKLAVVPEEDRQKVINCFQAEAV